jgi:hypothetical protein
MKPLLITRSTKGVVFSGDERGGVGESMAG